MSQQYDPNQYGQGQYPQGQYPPNPYGQPAQPSQYPQGQYPQGQYPPNPYAQPGQPSQYPQGQYPQQAYGQPQGYPYAAQPAPAVKETNPWAGRAILYGAISLVLVIIAFFLNAYIIGLVAFYAVYYSIRGIIVGVQKQTHPGIIQSVAGLALSLLAILITFAIIVLSAAANS